MRIAILHFTTAPIVGGVERVIADQERALCTLGHDVQVMTQGSGLAHDYDAIIVHNVFTMPFNLAWTRSLHESAAASSGVRWFNWVHDVAVVNPYYAHLPWQNSYHALLRRAPPKCIHVAVSEARRADYAAAVGIATSDIRVIPNGIDLAQVLGLTQRAAALQLWRHDLVLFHPARLLRRKNIELGIRLLAELRGRGLHAVYVVTGAPDPHQSDGLRYHQELNALAAELGVTEQILFLGEAGPLSDADVRSLYALADCLFFPSKGEGFGLPLIEAAMHRLPVFCSALAVHQEVIGDLASSFSLDATPGEIASQIIDWAAQNPDIASRRQLWRHYDMLNICQERLEPMLRIG